MEIIVSHNNTDLDGLASMIAANKLYPEAELVYAGKVHRNVREFMALHRDVFGFKLPKDIPLKDVTRLIMVDTKNPGRIGEVQSVLNNPGIDIHIFDHHPSSSDDIKGSYEVVEKVGAATTLLVELIRQKGISVNSFEATVFALGIYEDTGSLNFGTTTARDAEAVAYLLSQGARLSVVSEFIERPLEDQQKSLLNKLLLKSDTFKINGIQILMCKAETDEYIDGLALVIHKIMDIINSDVAIAVVRMEDRVHIVARSNQDSIDVSKILTCYNGGGHPSAASAVVRDGNINEIMHNIKAALQENVRPEVTAGDIMTAPVKMIDPDKSINEAAKTLLRYGHTGLPVVQDGSTLIGIISRRDIEKATHHGLGHAPVKGYMTRKVVTVTPTTTVPEIQDLMIENNIGRLPVIDNGRIVGIVSRTDILKTLHGDNYPGRSEKVYNITHPIVCVGDNVVDLFKGLPENLRFLLSKVSYLAEQEGLSVYAVGGFVRDLIIGVKNLDIDLVVEGNGPEFARKLARFLGGRVTVHEKFQTAIVTLPDGIKIDVVTARIEYYEYPAALPRVEESTLKQDLYRRDFTINAMAVALSPPKFGTVIDYFGGRRDLNEGLVRVLYNLSFVEDPTRILRAVRFEQRYGFRIEAQTLELARNAINTKMLDKLSSDRVREELKHILGEASPLEAVLRMEELGIWPYILPEANISQPNISVFREVPAAVEFLNKLGFTEINTWVVYLAILVKDTGCDVLKIDERLHLSKEEKNILTDLLCHCPAAIRELSREKEVRLSEIASIVRDITPEGLVYIISESAQGRVAERIESYFLKSQNTKSFITGEDIKRLGFLPGPSFKRAINAARDARLDGIITKKEEELAFVKQYMESIEETERG